MFCGFVLPLTDLMCRMRTLLVLLKVQMHQVALDRLYTATTLEVLNHIPNNHRLNQFLQWNLSVLKIIHGYLMFGFYLIFGKILYSARVQL